MPIRLRPHHLLCTQGYSGKGYSVGFVDNMSRIVGDLRGGATVEIVYSTDDICEDCPSMLGENLCVTNDKVNEYDRKVREYFGITQGVYPYLELTKKINDKITVDQFVDICSECQWYPISACKRVICGLGER